MTDVIFPPLPAPGPLDPVPAIELGKALVDALHLGENVYDIVIRLKVDDAAEITTSRWLTNEETNLVRDVMTRYSLCNPVDIPLPQPAKGSLVNTTAFDSDYWTTHARAEGEAGT